MKKERKVKEKKEEKKEDEAQQVEQIVKLFPDDFSSGDLAKRLKVVAASRGRRGTDKFELVKTLRRCSPSPGALSLCTRWRCSLLITAQFDTQVGAIDASFLQSSGLNVSGHQRTGLPAAGQQRCACRAAVGRRDDGSGGGRDKEGNKGDDEDEPEPPAKLNRTKGETEVRCPQCCFSSSRACATSTCALCARPTFSDYVDRLRDEMQLLDLAERVQGYYTIRGENAAAATCAAIRVDLYITGRTASLRRCCTRMLTDLNGAMPRSTLSTRRAKCGAR